MNESFHEETCLQVKKEENYLEGLFITPFKNKYINIVEESKPTLM